MKLSPLVSCLILASLALLGACSSAPKPPPHRTALEISKSKRFAPGRLVILQGPTSESEALINVFAPRLKDYKYQIISPEGVSAPTVTLYETLREPQAFYKIHKLRVSGLKPGVDYKLSVIDEFRKSQTVVDERGFSALNLSSSRVRFAALSCMADDYRFEEVIDPMWARLQRENPDFILLNGDIVYVDSFEFVERKKATGLDLWQRYIDSLRRLPLSRWERLTPVLATWDDHDYGTNDGDRDFISREEARRLFKGVFGGPDLPGVYENGPAGVSSSFTGFGQRFFLMDGRMYRQPNKDQKVAEKFGHWGEAQHKWLLQGLRRSEAPAWIVNGGQVFNGKQLDFKEAFEANHPAHFRELLEELKTVRAPVAFTSGDIHFSEIMRIPPERIGYETYEFTSSSMHSYTGEGWDNPARLPGAFTNEFNFMLLESTAGDKNLLVRARAVGRAQAPYFSSDVKIER